MKTIEFIACKHNGNITIKVKKDDQIYEAENKSVRMAVIDAVKKATGIEGNIEHFEANGWGKNANAFVIAKFNKKTIEGRAKAKDPIYLIAEAYVDAYNQFAKIK